MPAPDRDLLDWLVAGFTISSGLVLAVAAVVAFAIQRARYMREVAPDLRFADLTVDQIDTTTNLFAFALSMENRSENAAYNLGERSIQCGRRADALKVWLSWKAVGNKGFADKIDYLQSMKTECVQMIEQRDSLEMLAPAEYLNVLFRYRSENISDEKALRRLNIEICKTMMRSGGAYVDYAQYKGRTGIRLILANDEVSSEHLVKLLDQYERIGQELAG